MPVRTAPLSLVPMQSTTFASRAAHWSAAHRSTAILGWLAFVVVAFALGSAVGTVSLKQSALGNGESLAANRVLAHEFPSERAGEQVLFQSRSGPLIDGVRDKRATSSATAAR